MSCEVGILDGGVIMKNQITSSKKYFEAFVSLERSTKMRLEVLVNIK